MKNLNKALKACFVMLFFLISFASLKAQDTQGTDFWLMFNKNDLSTPQQLSLFITSAVNTSGNVSISGLAFSQPFNVVANTVTTVIIPNAASVHTSDVVDDLGIHVTSLQEVTVYGLNQVTFTTDAYLGLPVDILGTDYRYMNYTDNGNGHLMGIVATQNNTTVTVTPKIALGPHPANVPFNIIMQQGQTWEILQQSVGTELTGSLITSDKPIGVMGVHRCDNVPIGVCCCDHICEMLFPTNTWGKNFLTVPLATRLFGDHFRILASENATVVSVNGAAQPPMNAGDFIEVVLTANSTINSDKPVLVTQYSSSQFVDNVVSDPFMMLIPPFEQFLNGYSISTPAAGFTEHYVNVVAPNAIVGAMTLDGVAINAALFSAIGASGYSGAKVPIAAGSHTLAGSLPFGCFVYGFGSFDSYGYPGGGALSQIAVVSSLDVTPENSINPINTQHCVNGLVLDQNGAPLQGIRVDFERKGANPGLGFAFTDANGNAQYCYVGTVAGRDTIIGTTGSLADTVFKLWEDPLPVDLSAFTSTVNGKDVTLNWATSMELNNSGFDVERKSASGSEWTKLTFVPGAGTSNEIKNYSYVDRSVSSGKHNYRLKQIDINGNFKYYNLANEVEIVVPTRFNLAQNYPNPFNPTTKIDFELPQDGNILMTVYDNSGRTVATIAEGFRSAGYYSVEFNAVNLSSGVYFYKLQFNGISRVMKMSVVK